MKNLHLLVFMLGVLALVACGSSTQGGIQVREAWARPTLLGARESAIYMTVTNQSRQDDTLLEARSDHCLMVRLHESSISEERVMQMEQAEGNKLLVSSGESITFAPGSYHAMCVGVADALEPGEELPVTLVFEKAGNVQVMVSVQESAPVARP